MIIPEVVARELLKLDEMMIYQFCVGRSVERLLKLDEMMIISALCRS